MGNDERAPQRDAPPKVDVVDAYVDLCVWRAKHIPWLTRPEGPHLFFRLMTGSRAIAELYANAGASVPVVHNTLMDLSRAGLVKINVDQRDARRHVVQPTAQLNQLALAYVQRMIFCLT